jgi:hypothetical protein
MVASVFRVPARSGPVGRFKIRLPDGPRRCPMIVKHAMAARAAARWHHGGGAGPDWWPGIMVGPEAGPVYW